jgi:hypothetical protein
LLQGHDRACRGLPTSPRLQPTSGLPDFGHFKGVAEVG